MINLNCVGDSAIPLRLFPQEKHHALSGDYKLLWALRGVSGF